MALAHRRPRGDMHILAEVMHRRAGQGHPVFPADQRAKPAPLRLMHTQRRSVAARPDQTLAVGRHQLAVIQHRQAGAEGHLVVDEATPHPLVRADADRRAACIGELLQWQQPLVIGDNGLFEHDRMQRLGARVVPQRRAGRFVKPQRVAAQKRFAKGHHLRAAVDGLARKGHSLVDPCLKIERDRSGLNHCNGQGTGMLRHPRRLGPEIRRRNRRPHRCCHYPCGAAREPSATPCQPARRC